MSERHMTIQDPAIRGQVETIVCRLLEQQRHLARWWMRLPQRFPDQTWRGQVIAGAWGWSQRVLEMSGLLAETGHYTGGCR